MKRVKNKKISAKFYGVVGIACAMCMGLTACGEVVEESDSVVVVEHEKKTSSYTLAVVAVNNVVKTDKLRCTYRQVNEEEISTSVSGKKVENIYVKLGDTVKKGQLLFELEGADREAELEKLEYQIKRNELLLSYLDTNEGYEKSGRWWRYAYQSSGSDAEYEKLQSDLADITQSYEYEREDLEDAIRLDKLERDSILSEVEACRIYASMDGEISYIYSTLDSMTVVEGQTLMKIVDSSVCVFETNKMEYAQYFQEDDTVQLAVGTGQNAVTVEAAPYDMENWEANRKLTFALVNTAEGTDIKVGTSGVITWELERKEQVLCIPSRAIHMSNGKSYVYVLGENDIREVKWIETGVYGDTLVEVVSGLTEGENIILK